MGEIKRTFWENYFQFKAEGRAESIKDVTALPHTMNVETLHGLNKNDEISKQKGTILLKTTDWDTWFGYGLGARLTTKIL